eukprot:227002_1
MAIGYDNITDTIWLVGGTSNSQVVGYQRETHNFTDYGTSVFPQRIYGSGQYYCYNQFDSYLYIIASYGTNIHRFDVRSHELDHDHYSIPVDVSYQACLCLLHVDNGYLVVTGGRKPSVAINAVEILNISSNQWLFNVPSLNTARQAHTCNTFNNTIFVIGGIYGGGSTYLDTVEVFHLYDTEWTYTTDKLSTRMAYMTSILYQNEIVIFGGQDGSHYYDSINVINAITHKIYPVSSYIDMPLDTTAAINIAVTIYLFGGYQNNYISTWRYVSPKSFSPTYSPTNAPSNAPINAPSNVPSQPPTNKPSNEPTMSPTKQPTLTSWIIKNSDFCQDGYSDLSKNNSLYGIYCQPCADDTAGRYGTCHYCESPEKPNEERTKCEAVNSNNNIDNGMKITFQTYIYTIFMLLGLVIIISILGLLHSQCNKYYFDWK